MRIELRARHLGGDGLLQEHVQRRVLFALRRFESEVEVVTVRVEDVNGPTGGADKRCALTAFGPRIGSVRVEQTVTDARGGVDVLVERAARTVARALRRLQQLPGGARSRTPRPTRARG